MEFYSVLPLPRPASHAHQAMATVATELVVELVVKFFESHHWKEVRMRRRRKRGGRKEGKKQVREGGRKERKKEERKEGER
ncbi:hypothetical protein L345_14004, partial [Ophiophagus hannah]